MHELRLVAVSEDGTYLVLASAGRGTRFMLPVDDRLRAAVRGQFSRLGQYEIEVENPLRPKEIQARIRSGETAEAISEISGIPIERVRWFEGPVLQEREYIAQQAQRASVRAQGDAVPGPSLEELVTKRIGAHQLETGDAAWDSWKREDRSWQLKLVFMDGGEERVAHWLYEPRHNSVTPADEEAALFSSSDPVPSPGANVTPFAPRRAESATDLPRIDAQSAAERRPDHAVPRRRSSDVSPDEPLRPAPTGRAEDDRFGEARPAPAEYRDAGRMAERHPREGEWRSEPRVERPAERPAPRSEPVDQRRQRPEPVDQRRRPEPERWPEPEQRPTAYTEPMERPRRPERRPAPEWPHETRPARPAEPEAAPPAAEGPAQPRPAPRRRRATIDLNDTGTPRRAAEQPPAAAVPAAANGGSEHAAPKRKGRGRRASVPSWDEIMFGSKKDE
ncbi:MULTISPECIES: septation protein SepH [Nocardiopsis]|uniref:DUF3071 domain-containing protein n=1 Tax=Nocardiopsis sinuspersici TaxID=501010 RepID=A0A1V3C109_9ACTN|nr:MULTISPECIES: septation protein SepH [Nocardiopsis]OOC54484.1 hypothetical protein NOSIN_12260 [Nocardiopsis sinuspersici]